MHHTLRTAGTAALVTLLAACGAPGPGPTAAALSTAKIFDYEAPDCSKLVPGMQTFVAPTGLALGWEERTADLAFAVDQSFVDRWGPEWAEQAADLAAEMDEFFRREVNLGINAVQIVALDVDVTAIPSTGDDFGDADKIMQELITAYNAAHGATARDSVQFFLGAEVAGLVAGLANCIGGAGYPEVAYVWGEAHSRDNIGIGPVGFYNDAAAKVAIHEFGHMMAAHHHYSNCADGATGFQPDDANAVCGIMNNFADFAGNVFSTPNKLAIRSWAEQAGL